MEEEVLDKDIFTQSAEEAGLGEYLDYTPPKEEEVLDDSLNIDDFYDFEDEEFVDISDEDIDDIELFSPKDADRVRVGREIGNITRAAKAKNVPVNAKQLFQSFVKRGENPVLMAGLLGNAMVESSLNPYAIGDNGTSEGLFQWHNERRAGLRKHMANKPQNVSDAEHQVDYALKELRSNYPSTYRKAMAAKTPSEAAYIIAKEFERPKVIDSKRMSNAEGFFQLGGIPTINLQPLSSQGYTPVGGLPYSKQDSFFGGVNLNNGLPQSTEFKPQSSVSNMLSSADPTGISQTISAIDTGGASVVNAVNTGINGYKQIKDLFGRSVDTAVTSISSILEEKKSQRDYIEMLRKLYGEGNYSDAPLTTLNKPIQAFSQTGL
jgi:hypothetical protein